MQVLGISGSPVKNSNTDRLIQAILNHTGLETEFVKLSSLRVQPCRACLGCANDNMCKFQDDFQDLAPKIKSVQALVVGGYSPYGSLDGFTKSFLERLFSLRHQKGLNRDKFAVTVVTGNGRGAVGIDEASRQLKTALTHEGMEVLDQLKVTGNVKCVYCGYIDNCPMSALPRLFNGDKSCVSLNYSRVEDQKETWERARVLGQEIAARLEKLSQG